MSKVIVKDGNFNDAMRRFSRITSETRKSAKRHEYFLRPGLRKVEKSKEALKTKAKRKSRI
jgi:small subunit ribosomal protein S21